MIAAAEHGPVLVGSQRGYRTFSPGLVISLSMSGAALIVIGALGTWIRATEASSTVALPAEVGVVTGRSHSLGWVVAALGAAALLCSLLWRASYRRIKGLAVTTSLASVLVGAGTLIWIDRRAAAMAAGQEPGRFVAFHAGFGWGAWCLLVGVILLALGGLVGILRELDQGTQGWWRAP